MAKFIYNRSIVIVGTASGASAVAACIKKDDDLNLKQSYEITCKEVTAFSCDKRAADDIKRTFQRNIPENSVSLILLVYEDGVPNERDAKLIQKNFTAEAWDITAIVMMNCDQKEGINSCSPTAKLLIELVNGRIFTIGLNGSLASADKESFKRLMEESSEMQFSSSMVQGSSHGAVTCACTCQIL